MGRAGLLKAILVVFFIALYTAVPLSISFGGNQVIVPSAFILLVMVPVTFAALKAKIYVNDAIFIAVMTSLLFMSVLMSPGLQLAGEKLLGLVQTATSLAVGVLLVRLLDHVGRRGVAKILFVFLVTFAVGTALEVVGILRPISDSFREVAYSKSYYFVYDAADRDASITGFERAKFFASEPSVLAKGFLAFVNSWLLLAYNKKNLLVALLLTAVLFACTGSPVLVVSAFISVGIVVIAERRLGQTLLIVSVAGVVATFLLILQPGPVASLVERFQYAATLGSNGDELVQDSIGLRLILPATTLVDVWSNSPLFGVGISGKEVASSFSTLRIFSPGALRYGSNLGFGNNLTAILTYFGIVGSALFVLTLAWYFRRLRVRSLVFLFSILAAFSLTGGGLEEARFWGYVFLIVWAVRERDSVLALSTAKSSKPGRIKGLRNPSVSRAEKQPV
jgi:hypothetical protein